MFPDLSATPSPALQASSTEEFKQWIRTAISEVDDLRDAIQFAADNLGEDTFLDVLQRELESLLTQLDCGDYQHGDNDLELAEVVNQTPSALLPFRQLLLNINATHRKGLRTAH